MSCNFWWMSRFRADITWHVFLCLSLKPHHETTGQTCWLTPPPHPTPPVGLKCTKKHEITQTQTFTSDFSSSNFKKYPKNTVITKSNNDLKLEARIFKMFSISVKNDFEFNQFLSLPCSQTYNLWYLSKTENTDSCLRKPNWTCLNLFFNDFDCLFRLQKVD